MLHQKLMQSIGLSSTWLCDQQAPSSCPLRLCWLFPKSSLTGIRPDTCARVKLDCHSHVPSHLVGMLASTQLHISKTNLVLFPSLKRCHVSRSMLVGQVTWIAGGEL